MSQSCIGVAYWHEKEDGSVRKQSPWLLVIARGRSLSDTPRSKQGTAPRPDGTHRSDDGHKVQPDSNFGIWALRLVDQRMAATWFPNSGICAPRESVRIEAVPDFPSFCGLVDGKVLRHGVKKSQRLIRRRSVDIPSGSKLALMSR